jgi:FkbM family methyltransferase
MFCLTAPSSWEAAGRVATDCAAGTTGPRKLPMSPLYHWPGQGLPNMSRALIFTPMSYQPRGQLSLRLVGYRVLRLGLSLARRMHLGQRLPILRWPYWKLQRLLKPRRVHVDGIWLEIDPDDIALTHALVETGSYEPTITALLRDIVDSSDIFLDIGANIGYYTLLMGCRLKSPGRVIAIEPDPHNYGILARNVSRSISASAVTTLLNIAADDRSGLLSLYLDEHNKGDHRTYQVAGRRHCLVPALRLDTFCESADSEPNIIKIDVQGFEYRALSGMRSLLSGATSLLLITEFWTDGLSQAECPPADYIDLLIGCSFTIYEVGALGLIERNVNDLQRLASAQDTDTNLVCVKGELLERVQRYMRSGSLVSN